MNKFSYKKKMYQNLSIYYPCTLQQNVSKSLKYIIFHWSSCVHHTVSQHTTGQHTISHAQLLYSNFFLSFSFFLSFFKFVPHTRFPYTGRTLHLYISTQFRRLPVAACERGVCVSVCTVYMFSYGIKYKYSCCV